MPRSPERKSKRNSDNRKVKQARERVLDAAYDVFVANGYSGATTDMIQAASATSKATMYAHFRSKEVLFHEMVEYRISKSVAEYKEISNGDGNIEYFLSVFGYELLHDILSTEAVSMCRLMIAECTRFPLLGTLFYVTGPKAIADIVEMRLSEANRRNELYVPEPNTAAENFVGLIKGDFHLRALLGYQIPSEDQLKKYVNKSVVAFLKSYAPTCDAPTPDQ